jgi:hypothetical protein
MRFRKTSLTVFGIVVCLLVCLPVCLSVFRESMIKFVVLNRPWKEKVGIAGELLEAKGRGALLADTSYDVETDLSLIYTALQRGHITTAERETRNLLKIAPYHPALLEAVIIVSERAAQEDLLQRFNLEQQTADLAAMLAQEGYKAPLLGYWAIRAKESVAVEEVDRAHDSALVNMVFESLFEGEGALPKELLAAVARYPEVKATFLCEYLELLKTQPDLPQCLARVARYGKESGDYEASRNATIRYCELLAQNPACDGLSWKDRAKIVGGLVDTADFSTAAEQLAKVKALAPSAERHHFDKHLRTIEILQAQNNDFDTAVAFYELGSRHASARHMSEANAAFDKALELTSHNEVDQAFIKGKILATKTFWEMP